METIKLWDNDNNVIWERLEELVENQKSGWYQIRELEDGYEDAGCYGRNSKGKDEKVINQFKKIPTWEREMSAEFGKKIMVTWVYWDRTSAWTSPEQEPPFRPGFNKMGEDVKLKKWKYNCSWEASRYSRDNLEPLQFFKSCDRNKVQVWTEGEGIITMKNFADFIMAAVKSGSNNDSSNATSKRINSNRKPLNECGFYVGGGVPTGYRIKGMKLNEDGTIYKPLFPRKNADGMVVQGRVVEPIPSFVNVMKNIYKVIVEENGNLTQTGKLLQDANFIDKDTHSTKLYQRARYILTNPILVGYLTHNLGRANDYKTRNNRYRDYRERLANVQKDHLGNPVQGVEPILTMEQYLRLQEAISKKTFKRNILDISLLSGIIKCGRCGGTCSRSTSSSSKTGRQYSCNKIQTKECKGVSIVNTIIEEYVTNEFFARFDSEEIARNKKAYDLEIETIEKAMTPDMAKIEKLNSDMNRIMEAMLTTESDSLRKTLQQNADKIGRELDLLTKNTPKEIKTGNVSLILGEKFKDISLVKAWEQLDAKQKNALLSEAIEQVIVDSVGKGNYFRSSDGNHKFNSDRVRIWWKGEAMPLPKLNVA